MRWLRSRVRVLAAPRMGVILGPSEDDTGAHVLKRNRSDLMDWLGLRSPGELRRVSWLGPLVSILVGVAVTVLLVVVVVEFFAASMGHDPDATALRNAGLVLAAVLGVPFLIWRTLVAQKQADVAEQALFNDKLKAAADDLHARREIRRKKKLGDAEELGFIEDDIVRRVTAIDRLEALAQERPDEAPRIARLLCVYLRHLSAGIYPGHEEHPRADMRAAARSIGQMQLIDGVDPEAVKIDLKGANLVGCDLSHLSFRGADLNAARADTATLDQTDLSGAILFKTGLRGAFMIGTRLTGATYFDTAKLKGAALREFHDDMPPISEAQASEAFFDQTVTVPKSLRPKQSLLEGRSFVTEWRAFQKRIGFDPENQKTW